MVKPSDATAHDSTAVTKKKKTDEGRVRDFTVESIETIEIPKSGRVEYKDSKVPGLYLRVTKNGVRSFAYVGRAKNARKVERITIGKYPIIKPAQARAKAKELAGIQATGESVSEAGRLKRQEMTVRELWDLYYAYISKTNKDPESTKEVWDTYLEPKWGSYRLSDVSPVEVEAWFLGMPDQILKRRAEYAARVRAEKLAKRAEIEARRKIRKHGPAPGPLPEPDTTQPSKLTGRSTANRALVYLRAMYGFAMSSTRQYFKGVNPAKDHKKFKERERERFLQPRELGPFFAALAAEPNETIRDAILVALLTAQRRENVFSMEWRHVNLLDATWRIPGELTKNDDQHVVTLLPELVAILEQRLESRPVDGKGNPSKWVFPSSKGETGHIVDVRKAWRRILKSAGLTDLILHDLRRTLASWQLRTGTSLLMISKSLNHKSIASTQIYTRVDLDPVRESLQRASSAMFAAGGVIQEAELLSMPGGAGRESDGIGEISIAQFPIGITKHKRNR